MGNENGTRVNKVESFIGGAFGAGLALVVLPCMALYFGVETFSAHKAMVGLPIMAIFGIMILFGALALISTLFKRLGLASGTEALGLPEGSVRAAIALALIVLFAIISIMLYQSIAEPYEVKDLTSTNKELLLKEPRNHIIAVLPQKCLPPCAEQLYSVHLMRPQAQESTDIAKQLLILIGTLMTAVTSFYFGSRAAEPPRSQPDAAGTSSKLTDPADAAGAAPKPKDQADAADTSSKQANPADAAGAPAP